MKLFCICILLAFSLAGLVNSADGQAAYIPCVNSGMPPCSSQGFDVTNFSLLGDVFVYVQGYNSPGDSGGGTFASMNLSGTPCSNLANGGTILKDHGGNCFQRLDPNWGPKEFGAYGDGSHDDKGALKRWLNATQPHIGDVGTYWVSGPLQCNANTTIQGPSNVSTSTPLFTIEAFGPSSATPFFDSFGNTQAVISAYNFCRISGTGIIASQPLSVQGTIASGSTTVCVPTGTTGIIIGTYVTDATTPANLQANTTVQSFAGSCTSGIPVTISPAASGTSGSGGDTINFSSPISLAGMTNGNTTISGLGSISGISIGNIVTGSANDIPPYSKVTAISTPPCPCSVTISGSATGSHTETITFWGPDAVDVFGGKVTIDGFSTLSGGRYNLDCGDNGQAGELQIKDSLLQISTSDNAYMTTCPDARLIGDHVSGAGQNVGAGSTARGVVFEGLDLVLADGTIDASEGNALDLESAFGTGVTDVTVTGMNIATNGVSTTNGGYGVYIKNASTVSICGNLFHGNDAAVSSVTGYSAQVFFDGTNNSGISFCGNSYLKAGTSPNIVPQYVYDASSSAVLASASFYENPNPQAVGILSPNAAAVLPQTQVLPAPRAFLTGLVLSNGIGTPNTTIIIAVGSATDNTGVTTISLATACTVDITHSGLGGLDSVSSRAMNKTYFFFVVADETGANAPNCIASVNLFPNFTGTGYGAGVYRLVGALYTDSSSDWLSFQQDGDTFYLDTPVADVNNATIGTSAGNVALPSVPKGISVEALGRCIASTSSGGQYVLMFTPPPVTVTPPTPANFPTVPGYAMKAQLSGLTSAGLTSFPYRLYTDNGTHIDAQSSAASTTLNCMTDGWVWHRQQ